MNALKKLISFFLSIILFILVLAFTLNFVVKRVVQKQIISGVAKNQILTEYVDKSDSEHKEELKKLINDPEAVELANKFIDEYMEYVSDNNNKVSKKTVDSIIDFCVKHQKEINDLSDEEVTIEKIKSQQTRDDLTKTINESFNDLGEELGETPTEIITVYSNLTSNNFQIVLFISIIIVIVLLMLVKNSLYKWMSKLGVSLIITGLFIGGLYAAFNILIQEIIEDAKLDIAIKLDEMLIIAITEVIVGIILIVLRRINDKRERKILVEHSYNEEQKVEAETQPEIKEQVEEEKNDIE